MDRILVYPSAIPLDTDILNIQRNTMLAMGYIARATLGTGTWVDGLACTPTGPASLAVNIAPGSIGTLSTIDATAYGSLAANNTDPLVKVGINTTTTALTGFTAPVTAGQSVIYLVQAAFGESDSGSTVLPFYNAANPAVPYLGPGGLGTASNTLRRQVVQIGVKTGTPASVPVPPAVDVGYVALYYVTVAYAQTTIVAGNITPVIGAPFIFPKILDLPTVLRTKLTANLNLYVATTGSDTLNNGLISTSPFQTLQKAWNMIVNTYDLNGFNATVNISNGTYTGGLIASGIVLGLGSGNNITFLGNAGSPSSVTVSTTNAHCIVASGGGNIAVSGMTLTASGTSGGSPASGLVAQGGTIAVSGAMVFGACAGQQMWAVSAGNLSCAASYTISGSAQCHYQSQIGSIINISGVTVTLSGTPAYSIAFATTSLIGLLQSTGVTYSGAATGQRYNASANGVINTNLAGGSYFPGSSAGAAATGGQYV